MLREFHRVIGGLDSRHLNAQQTRNIPIEEGSGLFLQFEHDALNRERYDSVLHRSILARGFVHREVFRNVRGDTDLAVGGQQPESRGLVGNVDLLRVGGVDRRIKVTALIGEVRGTGQGRHEGCIVDLHAIEARFVVALVDLHLDLRVGIETGACRTINVADKVIAPLALGSRTVLAGHEHPVGPYDREGERRGFGPVDVDIVRILDPDVARILDSFFGIREGDRELGFRFAGTEEDVVIEFEDALLARRNDNGDRNGFESPGPAHLVGDLRSLSRGDFHLRG